MADTRETIQWLKSIKDKYIHGGDDSFDEKRRQAIDEAIRVLDMIANGVTFEKERFLLKENGEIVPLNRRWIPVTERLPEEGETVLVFGYWHEKWQPLMCYLSPHRKGEWFTSVAGQQVYAVTHWMPLPEPPKGE